MKKLLAALFAAFFAATLSFPTLAGSDAKPTATQGILDCPPWC